MLGPYETMRNTCFALHQKREDGVWDIFATQSSLPQGSSLDTDKRDLANDALIYREIMLVFTVQSVLSTQNLVTVKDVILRQLWDDDLGVVQAALSLDQLPNIVTSASLLDALLHVVKRCVGIILSGVALFLDPHERWIELIESSCNFKLYDVLESCSDIKLTELESNNFQNFVQVLPDIVEHRRRSIVAYLLGVISEQNGLPSLLVLLFQSLILRKDSAWLGNAQTSESFTSVVKREWEYAFAMEICKQYSSSTWLSSLVILVQSIGKDSSSKQCFFQTWLVLEFIFQKLQDAEFAFAVSLKPRSNVSDGIEELWLRLVKLGSTEDPLSSFEYGTVLALIESDAERIGGSGFTECIREHLKSGWHGGLTEEQFIAVKELLKMAVNRAASRNDLSSVQYALEVSAEMFKTDANNVSDYVQRHLISIPRMQHLREARYLPCWKIEKVSRLTSLKGFLNPEQRLLCGRSNIGTLKKRLRRANIANLVSVEDVLGTLGSSVYEQYSNENHRAQDDRIQCYLRNENFLLRWDSQSRVKDLAVVRPPRPWGDYHVGPVRDQEEHLLCAAFVATDLVSAARSIEQKTPYQMLSVKEICFYASPRERQARAKRGEVHHCHTLSLSECFKYLRDFGAGIVPDGVDKTFSCQDMNDRPKKVGDKVRCTGEHCVGDNIIDIVNRLKVQPLGATVVMFEPEYSASVDELYSGPQSNASWFFGLHSVMVVELCKVRGKWAFKCKSSHGTEENDKGYIYVCATTMVLGCRSVSESSDVLLGVIHEYEPLQEGDNPVAPDGYDEIVVKEAVPLISDFRCPMFRSYDLAKNRDNDDEDGSRGRNKKKNENMGRKQNSKKRRR